MEAYREIIDLKDNSLQINLPAKFKNGKVEVIVLPLEEENIIQKRKPSDFRGCISKDSANFMLKSIEESRKEWEKSI